MLTPNTLDGMGYSVCASEVRQQICASPAATAGAEHFHQLCSAIDTHDKHPFALIV